MTVPATENQVQDAVVAKQEAIQNNLSQQRKHYERQLEQERLARQQAEERAAELERKLKPVLEEDDDDDSEPYVDHKKLKKTLAKVSQSTREEARTAVQQEVQRALEQERRDQWLRSNPDFQDVMGHAQKLADMDPELAETILKMPEGFERQKLVYKNIKALGLHKERSPEPSIQQKIDANKRSPYYQPSGIASAPYSSAGDFSSSGQKNAYEKMQELKSRLRL